MYIWIFRTCLILLLFLRAAKFPRKLNEWWALCIVGASPLPACYHRPSSDAPSSGLANLDPSSRDILCPRFHPTQMYRMPEEECVGGSVYVYSLGISQTWRKRENNGMKLWREATKMPGVRPVAATIKTFHHWLLVWPELMFLHMQIRETEKTN